MVRDCVHRNDRASRACAANTENAMCAFCLCARTTTDRTRRAAAARDRRAAAVLYSRRGRARHAVGLRGLTAHSASSYWRRHVRSTGHHLHLGQGRGLIDAACRENKI